MTKAPRDHYDRLLERVSAAEGAWRARDICLFAARRGAQFTGGLMVVGRAPNGWRVPFPADTLADRAGRDEATARAFAEDAYAQDQMAWLSRGSMRSDGYKPGMSAFWRVIRRTVVALELARPDDVAWPATVAWSNLYKVAPDGANPPDTLAEAQLASCLDILNAEIDQLQPKRVLFLTGYAWAKVFLDSLGFKPETVPTAEPVEAAGTIESGARVVVTPHPQSRPETPIVREIARAFGAALPA